MKLLVMSDVHLSASKPIGRRGEYVIHVDRKLQEIADIAREHDVAAVLCGGDLFHTPAPSLSAIQRFLSFLERINCRFITIPGSHDLFGNNLDSLYRTAIGFLDRVGKLELLCSSTKSVTRVGKIVIGCAGIGVSGVELVHESVLPEPDIVGEFVLSKDYKTNAQLVIVGHYHSGYDLHKIGNTTFLCPGSVVRTSAQKSEFTRRPHVAILTDSFEITWIELSSALPGAEVLEPPVVIPKLDFSSTIREWSSVKLEGLNAVTLIRKLATAENIPSDVVEYALNMLKGN